MEKIQEIAPDLAFIAQDFTNRFKKAQYVGLQTVEGKALDFFGKKMSGIKITAIIRTSDMPYATPFQVFLLVQADLIESETGVLSEWQNMFDMLVKNEPTIHTLGGLKY